MAICTKDLALSSLRMSSDLAVLVCEVPANARTNAFPREVPTVGVNAILAVQT